MTVIATSTEATSTAYFNQRKIDRTSNGVLWTHWWAGTSGLLKYSTDNGVTWAGQQFGPSAYLPVNSSFFIDADDYAHLAWKQNAGNGGLSAGYIYYSRGTPSADRTSWTWSSAQIVGSSAWYNYPDIVAHREGSGWAVHIVFDYSYLGDTQGVQYTRFSVNSLHTITKTVDNVQIGQRIAGYNKYPSIDFHHVGDGKAVKDDTPHLYVGWSHPQVTGSGSVRFKKANYSSGNWSWGVERIIVNSAINFPQHWVNMFFDGSRVVFAGYDNEQFVYVRDAEDTTTTNLFSSGFVEVNSGDHSAATYDYNGEIYFISKYYNGPSQPHNLVVQKLNQELGELGVETRIGVIETAPYTSARKGASAGFLDIIYTTGTSSPYSINHYKHTTEVPAQHPGVGFLSGPIDPRVPFEISWTHFHPEEKPQIRWEVGYRIVGGEWTVVTEENDNTSYSIPANALQDEADIELRVRTSAGSLWGPYAVIPAKTGSWKYGPEISGSDPNGTLDTAPISVGQYEVEAAVSDGSSWSNWSNTATLNVLPENFRPNPPSNVIMGRPMIERPFNIEWDHNDPENDPQTKYQIRWREKL